MESLITEQSTGRNAFGYCMMIRVTLEPCGGGVTFFRRGRGAPINLKSDLHAVSFPNVWPLHIRGVIAASASSSPDSLPQLPHVTALVKLT
jgi:hypothetical protein